MPEKPINKRSTESLKSSLEHYSRVQRGSGDTTKESEQERREIEAELRKREMEELEDILKDSS